MSASSSVDCESVSTVGSGFDSGIVRLEDMFSDDICLGGTPLDSCSVLSSDGCELLASSGIGSSKGYVVTYFVVVAFYTAHEGPGSPLIAMLVFDGTRHTRRLVNDRG